MFWECISYVSTTSKSRKTQTINKNGCLLIYLPLRKHHRSISLSFFILFLIRTGFPKTFYKRTASLMSSIPRFGDISFHFVCFFHFLFTFNAFVMIFFSHAKLRSTKASYLSDWLWYSFLEQFCERSQSGAQFLYLLAACPINREIRWCEAHR